MNITLGGKNDRFISLDQGRYFQTFCAFISVRKGRYIGRPQQHQQPWLTSLALRQVLVDTQDADIKTTTLKTTFGEVW